MQERIFGDREKAMEDNFFRQEDEKLLAKLRQNARLDEITVALAEKLHVDNPELLGRVRGLGITGETAPAFYLAPLVQVAWASGSVSRKEHDTVLRLARAREIEEGSPAFAQLAEWLRARPSDELFDTAVEVLKFGFAVLPLKEREERIKRVLDACHEVASVSGKGLTTLLALGNTVLSSEEATLDAITAKLRMHG